MIQFIVNFLKRLFGRVVVEAGLDELLETLASSGVGLGEKEAAGELLSQLGAPAVNPLIDLLKESGAGELQDLISQVLIKIGSPAVGPLSSLLDGIDDGELEQVVNGILRQIQ